MSEREIQHFRHKHPLIFLENINNNVLEAYCFECKQQIPGPEDCKLDMDQLGAELPKEIQHPLHPQHPLTLHFKGFLESNECNACGFNQPGFFYCCSVCPHFEIDINCTPLKPTKCHEGGQLVHDHHQIQHLGQTHPLILCHTGDQKFYRWCSACNLPFEEDEIYVCLECKTLLHKSCFDQLALEIKHHPFHPQQTLTLYPKPGGRWTCWACGAAIYGCTYKCFCRGGQCHFNLHPRCASLMPTIWSELHEHLLVFFDRIEDGGGPWCSVCGETNKEVLTCVACNYTIHVRCNPILPRTIKIEHHSHALTLTYAPIKNQPDEDEDTELYCDACEERRYLHHPTYYCEECCNFVAHVSCLYVIPEVLRILKEEWLADVVIERIDEEIRELQKQIEAESKEVEALTSELNALEKKDKQMYSSGDEDSNNKREEAELKEFFELISKFNLLGQKEEQMYSSGNEDEYSGNDSGKEHSSNEESRKEDLKNEDLRNEDSGNETD